MLTRLSHLFRLLTFSLTRDEFLRFDKGHLAIGLVLTWIVGMGRWWDDPGAHLLQHLGVGSIIYVFSLSFLLWVLISPMMPSNWSYTHTLTFVTLTSLPALLYAIPVERFTTLEIAQSINVWFLAVVAAWRVALLFFYLKRHADLPLYAVGVAGLLPLTAIVTALTILNLERAAFATMSGLRGRETANDDAYGVLFVLTLLSVLLLVPLLVGYVVIIGMRTKSKPNIFDQGDQ